MISIYNLFESKDSRTWRSRAEVYIIKDNKYLIVGVPPKWSGYVIPGGGIDQNETPEDSAKREALEEIGTRCNNLKLISTTKIKHNEQKETGIKHWDDWIKKRNEKYIGSLFYTFIGEFDGYDKNFQSKIDEPDVYKPKEISIEDAILFFTKHKENCKKQDDNFNLEKADYILKTLKMIK